MIATISKQGGRRYPQINSVGAAPTPALAQWILSRGIAPSGPVILAYYLPLRGVG